MRVILTVVAFILFLGGINAQNAPDELIGKWKVVSVYAVDSLGTTDAEESAILTDGLVSNSVVEYQFDTTTFTLFIDAENIGSCEFTLDNGQFQFDENGALLEEYVNNLFGLQLNPESIQVRVNSPDKESGVVWYQTLTKQP